jgi:hypothetical protein
MKATNETMKELKRTIVNELKEQIDERLKQVCEETGTGKSEWKYNITQNKEIEFYHPVYGWYVFPIE